MRVLSARARAEGGFAVGVPQSFVPALESGSLLSHPEAAGGAGELWGPAERRGVSCSGTSLAHASLPRCPALTPICDPWTGACWGHLELGSCAGSRRSGQKAGRIPRRFKDVWAAASGSAARGSARAASSLRRGAAAALLRCPEVPHVLPEHGAELAAETRARRVFSARRGLLWLNLPVLLPVPGAWSPPGCPDGWSCARND